MSPSIRQAAAALAASAVLATSGCFSIATRIETDPEDARITVDGRDLGQGPVFVPGPEHGPRRTMKVALRQPGYLPREATVENEFDWGRFATAMTLYSVAGALIGVPYALFPRAELEPFAYVAAGLVLGGGTHAALTGYAFHPRYAFEMVRDPRFPLPDLAAAPAAPAAPTPAPDALAAEAALPPSDPAPVPEAATSDVDMIAPTGFSNPNAVAVVIGIERYNSRVPGVRFARRDALTMKGYLAHMLGVPAHRIVTLIDEQATVAAIRTAIEGQLGTMVRPGVSDVYVYYAGHGAPDVKTKTPFLVPHDGNPSYPAISCYPLDALYGTLGRLGARSATVMIDACFSGSAGRTEGGADTLVADARPLFIETRAVAVPKGLVVFAGATGEQLSSGFKQQQHGLFTYYLLRGLKGGADADGDRRVTAAEMQAYLVPQVAREARRLNREQTPVMLGDDQDRVLVRF